MIESNATWHVNITSTVKGLNGLSPEDIEKGLLSIKDPKYLEFRKECDDKIASEYGEESVANWQTSKGNEFEEKFVDGLKFNFGEDSLTLITDYEIDLPSDWDRGFVIDWSEGFNRLNKEFHFVQGEILALGEPRDKEKYNKLTELFRNIIRNEVFNVNKSAHKTESHPENPLFGLNGRRSRPSV